MGLVLLIIIWLITFVSTYFFIAKTWWLPVGASASAASIDHHFATTYILMGIVFVAAQVGLGFFVWRYRDRGGPSNKAEYSHGNTTLEIIWTVLTAVLFVGLNLMSSSIWASERFRPAEANAVRVVLPLSRTRRQVWRNEAGARRRFGRRRRSSGSRFERPRLQRRRRNRNNGGAREP